MPSELVLKFCLNCELRIANCELFCWHLKQFFDNPPQSIKKRIAALDVEAINYLLGRKA